MTGIRYVMGCVYTQHIIMVQVIIIAVLEYICKGALALSIHDYLGSKKKKNFLTGGLLIM